MSWSPKYKFFKLAPHCSSTYGHEWEVYKLNGVFKIINKIISIDKEFYDKYRHYALHEIDKDIKFKLNINLELAVIELGRELSGPLFKSWRTLYPDRYTVIRKLYKELRADSMKKISHLLYLKAEKIGKIIDEPTKDMYFILK